ncbi:chemotaxis protein CheR [Xenophilus sp. AP218F]|nr:chemotaxis protein CheR [Xenophilus sp. AP218F]
MAQGGEIGFTAKDFQQVREMLYQRVGIALNDTKRHMAYSRLAKRVRQKGMQSFGEYLALLRASPQAEEWQAFINALTTNLTFFFREPHHFELLRAHALDSRRAGQRLRIWSAAASTGEEPYSIAMTMLQAAADRNGGFELMASDIDTNVLQHALTGVYAADRAAKLEPALVRRFFERGIGSNEGKVRLKKSVREAVTFFQMNLVASQWPDLGLFDVIFCRNVLIYFDKPTQAGILERMARCLKPDGLLFLGHSENILHLSEAFVPNGKTSYRLAQSY